MQEYALKAAREGKQETSWLNPHAAYEDGVKGFIAKILDPSLSGEFLNSLQTLAQRLSLLGALNSLSQITLSRLRDCRRAGPNNPNAPGSPATATPPVTTEESDDKAWSFSASALTYIEPDSRNWGNPLSPGIAAGSTSKHATTTRRSTPARRGSATTSAAARIWRGNSRRCSPSVRQSHRRCAGEHGLAELVETRALQRGRACLRHGRFLEQFYLHLVGADLAPVEWFRFGLATQRTDVHQSDGESQGGGSSASTIKGRYP